MVERDYSVGDIDATRVRRDHRRRHVVVFPLQQEPPGERILHGEHRVQPPVHKCYRLVRERRIFNAGTPRSAWLALQAWFRRRTVKAGKQLWKCFATMEFVVRQKHMEIFTRPEQPQLHG